jgi:hypothetical protein
MPTRSRPPNNQEAGISRRNACYFYNQRKRKQEREAVSSLLAGLKINDKTVTSTSLCTLPEDISKKGKRLTVKQRRTPTINRFLHVELRYPREFRRVSGVRNSQRTIFTDSGPIHYKDVRRIHFSNWNLMQRLFGVNSACIARLEALFRNMSVGVINKLLQEGKLEEVKDQCSFLKGKRRCVQFVPKPVYFDINEPGVTQEATPHRDWVRINYYDAEGRGFGEYETTGSSQCHHSDSGTQTELSDDVRGVEKSPSKDKPKFAMIPFNYRKNDLGKFVSEEWPNHNLGLLIELGSRGDLEVTTRAKLSLKSEYLTQLTKSEARWATREIISRRGLTGEEIALVYIRAKDLKASNRTCYTCSSSISFSDKEMRVAYRYNHCDACHWLLNIAVSFAEKKVKVANSCKHCRGDYKDEGVNPHLFRQWFDSLTGTSSSDEYTPEIGSEEDPIVV